MCNLAIPAVLLRLIERQVRLNWETHNIRGSGLRRGKHEKHTAFIADAVHRPHATSTERVLWLVWLCGKEGMVP